jgi:hypothetical protein
MALSGKTNNDRWAKLKVPAVIGVVTNYLVVISLVVVFVAKEWNQTASVLGVSLDFPAVIVPYLLLTIVSVVIPRQLQMLRDTSDCGKVEGQAGSAWRWPCRWTKRHSTLATALDTSCRVLSLFLALYVDAFIWQIMPWLKCFVFHSLMFLCAALFLVFAIVVVGWFAKGNADNQMRWKTWVVGVPAFLLAYYLCVMTFSYRIYPNVPVSRGGRYPTSEVSLHYNPSYSGASTLPNPVYVIEQAQDFVYVVPVIECEWFRNDDPVYAVPTEYVTWMKLVRPKLEEPRARMCDVLM